MASRSLLQRHDLPAEFNETLPVGSEVFNVVHRRTDREHVDLVSLSLLSLEIKLKGPKTYKHKKNTNTTEQ